MIRVHLPFPPTTNNLFTGNGRGGRTKSKTYRAWCDRAGLSLLHKPKHGPEPFHLRITLNRPDRRGRDCSNYIKAPEDLLVAFQIIPDDSLAKSVHVEWSDREPAKDAWIEVEVTPA
jgi:Holliday junction resolvase RusA-like endonuclease